jgi:NAD+ kinase
VSIHRIGIVVHEGKQAAREAAETVRGWAARHDIPAVAVDVWRDDGGRRNASAAAAEAGNPDLSVTTGGQGTFLHGARIAATTNAQVPGVDVGRAGFLTEAGLDELTSALDAVHQDSVIIEERLTLTMWAFRPLDIPAGQDPLLRYGRGPQLARGPSSR